MQFPDKISGRDIALVHRLDGKGKRLWWQMPTFGGPKPKKADLRQNGALKVLPLFLLQMPIVLFIFYKAGLDDFSSPGGLFILVSILVAVVSCLFLFISIARRHRFNVHEVRILDDGMELLAPGLRRRIKWVDIAEFFPAGSDPPGYDMYALCLKNGDRYFLWKELSDCEKLVETINKSAAGASGSYKANFGIADSYFDTAIIASWAVLIAVGTNLAHAIFVPEKAQETAQIFNLVALSLLVIPAVAHWWIVANRVPQLVRAGEHGTFIRTRNRSFIVDWNQVTGIKRIAVFTILKTRTGWFAMMSGKEDPITLELIYRKDKLLTHNRQ
ncbi:MAG: hypothetical protein IPM23_16150 [Candidatus Melainabacteria bacterium]|nr:hypothetical protein [Candidatus Melainabacteria bacterium]